MSYPNGPKSCQLLPNQVFVQDNFLIFLELLFALDMRRLFFFFLRLFFVCAFSYSPAFGTKTVKVWCTFKYGMQNQSSTEYINIDVVVVVVVVVAHQSARNMVATMT